MVIFGEVYSWVYMGLPQIEIHYCNTVYIYIHTHIYIYVCITYKIVISIDFLYISSISMYFLHIYNISFWFPVYVYIYTYMHIPYKGVSWFTYYPRRTSDPLLLLRLYHHERTMGIPRLTQWLRSTFPDAFRSEANVFGSQTMVGFTLGHFQPGKTTLFHR